MYGSIEKKAYIAATDGRMDTMFCRQELKVLVEIALTVGRALDLDEALQVVLGILSENLAMRRATVTLKSGEKGRFAIKAAYGLSPEEKSRGIYGLGEGITGHIVRSGEPFVVPDVSREPLFLNKTGARNLQKEKISFVGVPIMVHGQPVGVLTVDRLFDERVSLEEDVNFLTIVAGLIGQFVSLKLQVVEREKDLIRANTSLKSDISDRITSFLAMDSTPAMAEVQRLIRKVAPTKATVLLLGESGTGKTLIARIIHELSPRASFPFVKVNVAALTDHLLESELFGHEKGAFPEATEPKIGRLEEAHGGTILLDEITELPQTLQAKLLGFLQEREFERVGGSRRLQVDVRIIAATDKDLPTYAAEDRFRKDLFYRLNVFPIVVPPLRDRRQDIRPLLEYFRDRVMREYVYEPRFSFDAMTELENYDWPGNIREMENLMERLAIIAENRVVDADRISTYLSHQGVIRTAESSPLPSSFSDMERHIVLEALERSNWVQTRAAKELGITLRQMGYKVKKFGLQETVRQKKVDEHNPTDESNGR